MTFKPILWTYEPRKDGVCAVKIYGKRKYFHTDVAIHPDDWDAENLKVKRSNPLHAQMNAVIKGKIIELEKILLEGGVLPTKKVILAQEKVAEQPKKVSVVDFIQQYINEAVRGEHNMVYGTIQSYQSLHLRLCQFGEHRGQPVYWEDINQAFYADFWQFLHHNFGVQKEGGFSKHIKNIKKFMSEAQRRGLHQNNAHRESAFKVYRTPKGKKIYLSVQEVEKLEQLDLSSMPWLEVERDRWLICYYFLLRYQDGQDHTRRENFFESGAKTFFRYDANKTGIAATIPVKPKALEILEKYNFQLPKTTNQEANRKIKMIASMAGITNVVQEGGQSGPKCNFVRTHTARRSAATNLAMQGVPLDFIARLGGWNNMDTLKKYLLASGLDVAMVAAEYEFFR